MFGVNIMLNESKTKIEQGYKNDNENQSNVDDDIDEKTNQPLLDAEKNLSRHATADSSPDREDRWKRSVPVDNHQPRGNR
jgi:hypothetical protein